MKPLYHGEEKLRSASWEGLFEKKLNKLPLLDSNAVVDVYLSKENQEFITKVKVSNKGKEYIASAQSRDMYRNITISLENLKTQLFSRKQTHSREVPEVVEQV